MKLRSSWFERSFCDALYEQNTKASEQNLDFVRNNAIIYIKVLFGGDLYEKYHVVKEVS